MLAQPSVKPKASVGTLPCSQWYWHVVSTLYFGFSVLACVHVFISKHKAQVMCSHWFTCLFASIWSLQYFVFTCFIHANNSLHSCIKLCIHEGKRRKFTQEERDFFNALFSLSSSMAVYDYERIAAWYLLCKAQKHCRSVAVSASIVSSRGAHSLGNSTTFSRSCAWMTAISSTISGWPGPSFMTRSRGLVIGYPSRIPNKGAPSQLT